MRTIIRSFVSLPLICTIFCLSVFAAEDEATKIKMLRDCVPAKTTMPDPAAAALRGAGFGNKSAPQVMVTTEVIGKKGENCSVKYTYTGGNRPKPMILDCEYSPETIRLMSNSGHMQSQKISFSTKGLKDPLTKRTEEECRPRN